jgi:adenylate cyclase
MERRLSAILAADVVGYSRLMGADEAGTLAALKACRNEVIDPKIAAHGGRIVKLMGDGALVEFPSVVEAVQCAVEIQQDMAEWNIAIADDRRIEFRIGINVGDVIVEGDDIYGDGVNIAARLEGLAEPGGICISHTVHDQIRDKLDLTVDDLGEVEVKNIARPVRVFRLVTDGRTVPGPGKPRRALRRRTVVTAATAVVLGALTVAVAWDLFLNLFPPAGQPPEEVPAVDAPGIAVLPFDNMSGNPEEDYFSDGITEDLITDLSQVSGLFVIARNTMFTYEGKAVKVQDVARELGVRYVLEGSVRRAGDRIRVNAQLVDARDGHHLWAERFDREMTDVFALQDEVTQRIVSALAVKLTTDEEARLSSAAAVHPEAYDVLLRGLERYRRYSRETNDEARQFFERAIALDPQFARAYADLALTYYLDALFGWASVDQSIRQAQEAGQAALALDQFLPQVHFALSDVYRIQKRHDDAIAEARRAVELDPNYADGYAVLGLSLIYSGRHQEGLEATQKAMRLNPRHPFFYVHNLGHAHFLMGRYEEAISAFEKVLESNPHFPGAHLLLAAAYGQLGRVEDAEWEAAEVLTLLPQFSIADEQQTAQYKEPTDLERYIEGLRKAGLPE